MFPKASLLSAKPPIPLENLLQVYAKQNQKLGCSGSYAKFEHDTHTPQQAWEVWHQGLAIMYMYEQPLMVAT